jgi:predicted esterase
VRTPLYLSVLLLALAGCGHDSTTAPPEPSAETPAETPVVTTWCGEGWRAVDGGTFLAVPEHFANPPSLVIFAHGIVAPGERPIADQATLLAAADKLGFAVLFGRGRKGLCDWEAKLADHYCWPVKRETVDRDGAAIVTGWAEAQLHAAKMAGVRFDRRYLVGFSNGGYFAAYVALEGLMPLDGVAVVGSGRSVVDESKMAAAHPPLYLAVGDQDAPSTREEAENLAQVLTRRTWPLTYVVHPQRGHELHQDDLVAAWAAWGR